MIVAFKIRGNFSYAENFAAVEQSCQRFAEYFPNDSCEFFYYFTASDPERWFFIKTATKDAEKFIQAATEFGNTFEFEILTRSETIPLLKKIDLNLFI